MHMRKILCLSVVLTLISLSVWAQRTVTGRVTDERNNPLPNVSILVKGTNSGTVSKEDGSFSLVVPNNAKTLVVSFTDMATREVDIEKSSDVTVTMSASQKDLQEVVVTAFGIRRDK